MNLRGLHVLDLTRNVAGPYCTMILGDLGADVIKVERTDVGDDTRAWAPPSWEGVSTTYLAFNRNKRSIAVDLDHPQGRAIARSLAEKADVLVESFRPGSLARRGLGYEEIRQVNPGIVYCSISGFGSTGPHSSRAAYDPVIQAYSGIMSVTGEDGAPPVRVGTSLVDMGTGLWSAIGILSALVERERTGIGGRVETSLLEVGLAWLAYQFVGYLATGVAPRPMGSKLPMIAPYEVFDTLEGYLFVGAPNDVLFRRLCTAIGASEQADDPRFVTNTDRVSNRDDLHAALAARFRTDTAERWEMVLTEHQVPCSRVRSLDDVAEDEQVAALRMFVPVADEAIPDLKLVRLPVTFQGSDAAPPCAPPRLGEHTEDILQALGLDREAVQRLRSEGVVQ